jgi:hypothetical protein
VYNGSCTFKDTNSNTHHNLKFKKSCLKQVIDAMAPSLDDDVLSAETIESFLLTYDENFIIEYDPKFKQIHSFTNAD